MTILAEILFAFFGIGWSIYASGNERRAKALIDAGAMDGPLPPMRSQDRGRILPWYFWILMP